MHITELAKKLDVDAHSLDKALLIREYTDNGIVPDDICENLIFLYEYYISQLQPPVRVDTININLILKPCIYFLYHEKTLIYIGKSLNLLARLSQHIKDKTFDGIHVIEVPRKDLDILELFYISQHLPFKNIDGRDPMQKIKMLINKI